jgi:hypothetical protein
LGRIELVDICDDDATIHIRVDSSHIQKYEHLRYQMLEQMITSTYDDASVTKATNEYGLLTDVWIHFKDPNDAMHFKLCHK